MSSVSCGCSLYVNELARLARLSLMFDVLEVVWMLAQK